MSVHRSGMVFVSLFLTLLLTVTACSSSRSSNNSGATTNSSESTSNGKPIKIGLAVAATGSNASLEAPAEDVAKSWVKDVTAAGGIGGRPVELSVVDTQSSTSAGLAAAKKLVEQNGVSAMLVLDSVAELPIANYLQTKQIPMLGITYNTAVAGKLPNVFSVSTGLGALAAGQLSAAKASKATTFGVVVCAESPACGQVATAYKALAPSFGVNFAGSATVAASAPDYTAACLALMTKGAGFIELDVAPSSAARVAQDCMRQGYKGTFGLIGTGLVLSLYSKFAGVSFAGSLNAFPWWADSPAVSDYRAVMKKYSPSTDYRQSTASGVWAALQLFKQTMAKTTGDVASQSVISAYGQIKNETLNGLLPQPMSFIADKPGPAVNCLWLFSYKGGADNPTTLPDPSGKSGNGQTADLSSTCEGQ